jgi:NitT/TauT family transport system ATP-binding protein
MSKPYLAFEAVTKEYAADTGPLLALDRITFGVAPGEFVSIIGPSGCGKSTLLKMTLGLVQPSAGRILIDQRPVAGPQVNIGMVFQTPALPPWRRVLDNVLLPIEVLDMRRADFRDKAKELLALVGLQGFEDRWPRELSGGMSQRVGICRALIHDPGLLLMDEPFGALDAMTRESLQALIQGIWQETRKTILFVTHSIDEAVLLSDRVILLSPRPGQVAQEVAIDLARPRTAQSRSLPGFQSYALGLRHILGLDRSPG